MIKKNLLAYSGLEKFSIREESSRKEIWLAGRSLGLVFQV